MVSNHRNAARWTMEPTGKIRLGAPARSPRSARPARADGWIDASGHIGAVETVDGEPAHVELLPSEVLDLLEARFPGTRWFVGDGLTSAA
ncbi:MAG: hypothetical protein ACF8Q5_04275 [Phycisphaerales bacterium JB040]